MKNLQSLLLTTALTGVVALSANAQYVGAACGCPPLGSRQEVLLSSVVDANNNLPASSNWDCSKLYVHDVPGPIYVNNGSTLTIGAGTVIKSEDGTGANASSLVVSRGGKIFANGSAECKIVFTTVNDVNVDGSYAVTNTAQWGGVIVLGRAQNNLTASNTLSSGQLGEGRIEGLVGTDARNLYGVAGGAFINNDNSGVIRYVSIRHGGAVIGANNEVNGLTCGSVGSGTVIENVEIVANEDDPIEMFGGTANLRYISAFFCKDDGFDTDQAYTGNVQFLCIVQTGPSQGDKLMELDGEDDGVHNAAVGLGFQNIFNVTAVGYQSPGDFVSLKENFRGTIANSIFVNSVVGFNLAANVEAAFLAENGVNLYSNTFDAVGDISAPNTIDALINGSANITEAGVLPDFTFDVNNPSSTVGLVPAVGFAGNPSFVVPAGIEATSYRGAFAPGQTPWIAGSYLDLALDALGNLPNNCRSDLNGDGLINGADFGLFGGDYAVGSCD